jgi:hypothetical protein
LRDLFDGAAIDGVLHLERYRRRRLTDVRGRVRR